MSAGIERSAAEQMLQLIPPRQSPGQDAEGNPRETEPNSVGGDNESGVSFELRMMEMMEGFSQKLNDLAVKVDSTDQTAASGETSTEVPPITPSTSGTPTKVPPIAPSTSGTSIEVHVPPITQSTSGTGKKDWADCLLNEPLDSLPPIQWLDEEAEPSGNLVEVSEETTTFLKLCFGKALTNTARHSLVGFPKVDATKCPKLDRVVKGSVSKDMKEADNTVAKLQTLPSYRQY